jgi:DNA (cytosine-5)-methyltransferase 1
MQLVLSLFPGIDLLGRGFENAGFCIVRGPDLIFGGDVRAFHVAAGKFDGVIGGSPCPDFSTARRTAPTGDGLAMLAEFRRVVLEAQPAWWLLENVPACPNLTITGYSHQRIDIDARDVGLKQRRLRHFQFGNRDAPALVIGRPVTRKALPGSRTCMAREGTSMQRRRWPDFCELQGLPRDFELPSFTKAARYRAVGNGVPPPVAELIARAIRSVTELETAAIDPSRPCACGCARPVAGRMTFAGPACRKRAQRRRDASSGAEARAVTIRKPLPSFPGRGCP